eukprot:m.100080 g.100080  ORF g.100080 m.100080 type:complete len:405 (-) comp9038_c0_seq2:1518-2732(-)
MMNVCSLHPLLPFLPFLRHGGGGSQRQTLSLFRPVSRWYRVLFFGTDDFSLPSLKRLHENCSPSKQINSLEVVCPILHDGGRKKKTKKQRDVELRHNAVRLYCEEHVIPTHDAPILSTQEMWRDWVEENKDTLSNHDLGVVVSFGYILPDKVIDSFENGMINVHPSEIPKYRGAAPLHHTILNGEEESAVTVLEVSKQKADVGKVLNQHMFCVNNEWKYNDLREYTSILGANLLLSTIDDLETRKQNSLVQSSSLLKPSIASKRKKEHSYVDWNKKTSFNVRNMYRAYVDGLGLHVPQLSTSSSHILVHDMEYVPEAHAIASTMYQEESEQMVDQHPGSFVISNNGKMLIVRCKDDGDDPHGLGTSPVVFIKSLQFPTRNPIGIKQFINQETLERGVVYFLENL